MSRLRRDKARKRLNELLSLADDEAFLVMVWAVDALQSGQADVAARYLTFPCEAKSAGLGDNHFVFKWYLETLVNELLITRKKAHSGRGRRRSLNCSQFGTIAGCANVLRELEDAEDGMMLARSNVLDLMHKTGHRQFEWQRGFANLPQIYRSLFVFGGDLAKGYFDKLNQLSLTDFFLCGIAFYALSKRSPAVETTVSLSDISISSRTRDAALRLLSAPLIEVQRQAIKIRQTYGHSTAYQQSVLRKIPIISIGLSVRRVACSPLPELIMLRVTAGLYYDLVGGGPDIWREIGLRYESYCLELMKEALPGAKPSGSFKYKFKKTVDSPDLFLHDESGAAKVVIECKAKKMSVKAKFSDNPLDDARQAFSEIIKGVLQLWRFFSHCRRSGIRVIAHDAVGMVLTLDPWLQMSNHRDRVMEEARGLARIDPQITEQDRKAILFCPIEDLEYTLGIASDASFFEAIAAAASRPEFEGWSLVSVHQKISTERRQNPYPFADRIADILPSWHLFKDGKILGR